MAAGETGVKAGRRRVWVAAAALVAAAAAAAIFRAGGEADAPALWRPGTPLAQDQVKVCVIHVSNLDGPASGYAQAHELGLRRAQKALGLDDGQFITKTNVSDVNQPATEHSMRECLAAGANVVVATSWNHMPVCARLATEFPGAVFANATGSKHNNSNFTNYFGRVYQARYLAGLVAGYRTATGQIGYVAAMGKDNSEVTGGLNAFALGVEKANPEARVQVRVTHRWYDPEGEERAARELIAAGCDVIAQHSNTAAPQIAAQDAGVWGIGYNSDLKADAPKAVITSVVWNWGVYYTRLLQSVIDGSFTAAPYLGGLDDGLVALTPLDRELLPAGREDEILEAVETARAKIESGAMDVFEGEMETNGGWIVGRAGERLSYEEISLGINWYYRNVIEAGD